MKVTYNWLKDYIQFDETPQELADKLTEAGFEVEEMYPLYPDFSGVIVGKVESVKKHPDADKLSVCIVNDGQERYQVICGAPNVAEGQTIPFAKIGAELPNGFKIKKVKIRGVESFGMICSREELGLEDKSDGIWVIKRDYRPGSDLNQLLQEEQDIVYDFFITPNRPDCLSVYGIAREVAAITGNRLRFPEFNMAEDRSQKAADMVSVSIEDLEGCPRYAARVIRGVTVCPSPEWMQKRLKAVGIRPINNIVDITNYVLMEVGHPLHAFDLKEIKGNEIRVRASRINEKFTTLDGKEREIPEKTVMICDKERAVAIGGIMGGQNSEVSDSTTDILLECAYFNPRRIAVSAKKLGLSSEASQRFERGVDPNGVLRAIDRAASLIGDLGSGKILSGVVDVYSEPIKPAVVSFRPERVNKVLGASLNKETIVQKLQSIQLDVNGNQVTVPTFRVDLKNEIDLIEEVARLVNFSNLPSKKTTVVRYEFEQAQGEVLLQFLRRQMLDIGLQEILTNSMLNKEDAVLFEQNTEPIHILNPISDDMSAVRPSLLPGMLKSVAYNINRNQFNLHFFEIGRVFTDYRPNELPHQPYHLAAMITGNRYPEHWSQKSVAVDFYDIKGLLETFLDKIFLDNIEFILYDKARYLDSSQTIAIQLKNDILGVCGKINDSVCTAFGIERDVFAFELDVDALSAHVNFERTYEAIPKYPYVEKDLAFVISDEIQAAELLEFIRKTAGPLLREVTVFDVFTGESVPQGKKSVAIRLRFQSTERTLKDEEVDVTFRKVIRRVSENFGITLRD